VHLVAGFAAQLAVLQAQGVDQVAGPRLVGVGQAVQRGGAQHGVLPPAAGLEGVDGGVYRGLGHGPVAVGVAADALAGGGVEARRAGALGVGPFAVDPVPCLLKLL
jgi:hypothetical protein